MGQKNVQPPIPSEVSQAVAIGIGIFAGGYMAKVAAEQMFKHGLDSEERKGMLILAVTGLCLMAAKQFSDIDERWYDITALASKLPETIEEIEKAT